MMSTNLITKKPIKNQQQAHCTVDYKHVPPSTLKKFVIKGYPQPNMPRL